MSISENSQSVTNHVIAMVRAFGDEPVKLLAKPVSSKVVEVASLDGEVSSGFAPAYVYDYDDDAYRALTSAYEHADTSKLRSLWSVARRLAFA